MRNTIAFVCLMLISSLSIAFAQGNQGGPRQRMSVEERVAELKTQLTLSDDQVSKITKILQKQRDTMQVLRDKFGDDREGMRAEMGKIREKTDKDIMALLSDVQKKKYEEIIAQRQQRMGGQAGAPNSPNTAQNKTDTTKTKPVPVKSDTTQKPAGTKKK